MALEMHNHLQIGGADVGLWRGFAVNLENTEKSRYTLLDTLSTFTSNQEEFDQILNYINTDKEAQTHLKVVEPWQLRVFFYMLMNGFEYIKKKYGSETIPSNLIISPTQQDVRCGYVNDLDALLITPELISDIAGNYEKNGLTKSPANLMRNDHMEEGLFVSCQSGTVLLAVEEGYHRYSHRVLNMPEVPYHTIRTKNPFEIKVKPIIHDAIIDLRIPTYRQYSPGNWTRVS